MRRREFLGVVGGAALAWPLAARAQQAGPMRRIGVLASLPKDDPEMEARLAAFKAGLKRRGWSEGHNIQIEYRYSHSSGNDIEALAKAMVALKPDLVVVHASP